MALKQLTIAGGGLAGLALGIALRRRMVPVLLCEATAYPRHRVCGEFLSGMREEELSALGIADLFQMATRPRETLWFDGATAMFKATLPEPAYGLSRRFLDDALAQRFMELGGTLVTGKRLVMEARDGMVLATGRLQRPSPWLGLKAHFVGLALRADLEVHLADKGYVGLTQVEDGRVNVSGLFNRSHSVPGGQSGLVQAVAEAGLPDLAGRLREGQIDPASLKGVNRFHLGWQLEDDDAVRVGDAAVMIPPFTGNGMTMALQGALMALEPIVRWAAEECSWKDASREIRHGHKRLFSRRLRWARGLQAILLQPIGRRLCGALLARNWLSFETLYRKLR